MVPLEGRGAGERLLAGDGPHSLPSIDTFDETVPVPMQVPGRPVQGTQPWFNP